MKTWIKALFLYAAALVTIAAMLFVPAGTLDYWQGWLYLIVMFIPVSFVMFYFLAKDPSFLEKRFQMKEKERAQKFVQKLGALIFFVCFLLPGFDIRFGWSNVPPAVSISADIVVLLGYAVVFWVFRENSFAGRTIIVEKGQTVISSGPYSVVRHPMYVGMLALSLATPIALGSYLAILPFLLIIPLFVLRIRNEEEVLTRELKGYNEYCRKVRYRLAPGFW